MCSIIHIQRDGNDRNPDPSALPLAEETTAKSAKNAKVPSSALLTSNLASAAPVRQCARPLFCLLHFGLCLLTCIRASPVCCLLYADCSPRPLARACPAGLSRRELTRQRELTRFHPQLRERRRVQRRERHLRHGVGSLLLRPRFHDGCHEDPGLGPDAPYHERFHDDDHAETDFDDHALNDVRNHEERRLPIRLDLHVDRHLPDHLSGHVPDHLSGRLCGRLSGHECSHVCGRVSDRVSEEIGNRDTSMKSPLSSSEFDSPPESFRSVPV